MPSHMPSSFAAAAGQGASRDPRNGRGDGRGSGDWARRESRPTNGTLTLRRSSTTPFAQSSSQAEPPLPTPTAETPGHNYYNDSSEYRISKEQLLDIYKAQEESGARNGDVSHLFESGWNPGQSNGGSRASWGKSSDNRDNHAADICWDTSGNIQPIGLEDMTDQEKTLFSGDVNSPLKPPPQNQNKDQAQGANGRKTSVSQGSNAFGLASPASSRPSTRRQQTSDSITGLASPSGTGRFSRDEASPFFTRKFDPKEGEERADEGKSGLPFGGLMRANTAGNGPSSPWGAGPTSATMAPMGAFGNFGLTGPSANPPAPIDKRPTFGRGESRLAQFMAKKESTEDMSAKAAERPWRPRQRTDTDPFADEPPSGSAVLGGGDDLGANHQQRGLDTPVRGVSGDFGMSDMPSFLQRTLHQTPQAHHDQHEPQSPSDTNPYRSPPEDRHDTDDNSYDGDSQPQNRHHGLGGIPEHGQNPFGTLPRGFANPTFDGSDRSQTSSVAGNKGFPQLGGLGGLSGLGNMGGWPTSGNPIGTPNREGQPSFPNTFGNSLFGPMGDLQSPSLGGLGSVFGGGPGSTGTNTIGRGSKLGSLFPAAMQAQMQANDDNSADGDMRQGSAFGAIGRNAFQPSRDTDSPMRTARHPFEDLFPSTDSRGAFSSSESAPGQTLTSQSSQSNFHAQNNDQLPTAQQRMMVMPDRMRWVYLDPQGNQQGPFSGLEMHDWYKASFFTPDLSVKKMEDEQFEPLGQLIRRIGNSREPFLVPQIGIPHGPPTAPAGTGYTPPAVAGATAQPGAVQPPFADSFPSFGTTLTAEQQNNLERRKQEEQYLMARQREFLAQQQVNMKQMQMSGLPSSLHHHSSAHSLQSQPSFGSMTSPIGMPPQPPLPGVGGFFEGPPRQIPTSSGLPPDFFREDDLARLSLQDRQAVFNAATAGPQLPSQVQPVSMHGSFAQRQDDPQGFKARLRQFQDLREEHDLQEAAEAAQAAQNTANFEPITAPQQQQLYEEPGSVEKEEIPEPQVAEPQSLTQRIQKAASAKQSPTATAAPESPWGKVNTGLPMPFPPPPQSTTPLPAPLAQRGRSNLPEALNVEARSRSETPEASSATPSIAPWAKESTEAPKALSLKEIQEAEARKAAKAEEIAAAVRRANYEQELKMLSNQPIAPAPGLPISSTWGNTVSPATPTNAPSAWAKPAAKVTTSSNSKKTLAEIQQEEEKRKQKLAAQQAAAQVSVGITSGKRYADLASKTTASVPSAGGAWATVGAGGKVKVPTGPAAAVPQTLRSVSSASVVAPSSSRAAARPATARSATTAAQSSVNAANSEFNKWAKASLTKGLNSDINVDNFLAMLNSFPSDDSSIIADSVYSSSQLMDGKRFAQEFIRRRKQAEKGIVEPSNSGSGTGFTTASDSSGGWSEVAKKGPVKEEPTAGFKVVPNKKKGKK